MKGYWFILGTDITDEEAQQKYGKLWAPLAEKCQARLNPTKIPPMAVRRGVPLLRASQCLLRRPGLSGSPAVCVAGIRAGTAHL